MGDPQPGILLPPPPLARYLLLSLEPGADPKSELRALCDLVDGQNTVVGLGLSLILALGKTIDGLRPFPRLVGKGIDVPSTPAGVWIWLRGEDRGELLHRSRRIRGVLARAFSLDRVIDAFTYKGGRDLTGFEDGTENPKDHKAVETAIVRGRGAGLDGSSFVAVQQWVHHLDRFDAMSPHAQDASIGRRKSTNEEMPDAPPSAHVKRSAQESFEPEAFVLRRSMPWADGMEAGLVFVAFGKSFDAFEAQLRRMTGLEDGVSDALFSFTRPVSGAYYWCPPRHEGRLDSRVFLP